jgi:hypothetical protein
VLSRIDILNGSSHGGRIFPLMFCSFAIQFKSHLINPEAYFGAQMSVSGSRERILQQVTRVCYSRTVTEVEFLFPFFPTKMLYNFKISSILRPLFLITPMMIRE